MIAAVDEKIAARVGKLAFFNILDPSSVHANRDIVFGFACDCTGMAANTLTLVDDKGVFRHVGFLLIGKKRNVSLAISVSGKPEFV